MILTTDCVSVFKTYINVIYDALKEKMFYVKVLKSYIASIILLKGHKEKGRKCCI